MKKIKEAAFRDVSGKVVKTGPCHNIDYLPEGFEIHEEGFIDEAGGFISREQATNELNADHPVQSEELDLVKSLKEYEFEGPIQDPGAAHQLLMRARHQGKVVATLTFNAKPHSADNHPALGYHAIGQADVSPLHRGNGVYGRMLQQAALHVKKTLGSKGLISHGEWRSEAATGAWEKLQTKGKAKSKPGKDPESPDFFMSEKPGVTSDKNKIHEFLVEYRRWLEARQAGGNYQANLVKTDVDLHELVGKHGNLSGGITSEHHKVAREMAGHSPLTTPEFMAAHFLAGGERASDEMVRAALILYDDDFELAALRAYGLPRNEEYRELLRATMKLAALTPGQHLDKSDLDVAAIPRQIKAGNPAAEDTATQIRRAEAAGQIESVQLDPKAKHSKGTAIAHDPETGTRWLLKPGSGKLSPSAGVREEAANQSAREVAFSKVADALDLGDDLPKADLVLVDNVPVAAMELLGFDYSGFDKVRRSGKIDAPKFFQPYWEDGTILKWAFLDWILGNPDRHANNIMVNEDLTKLKLIDHGSAFAGPSFNPANDPKSFIPFYLRAWGDSHWSLLSAEERKNSIPQPSEALAKEFGAWVDGVNESQIAEILNEYGINAAPTLDRLKALKAAEPEARADELINSWVGVVS